MSTTADGAFLSKKFSIPSGMVVDGPTLPFSFTFNGPTLPFSCIFINFKLRKELSLK